MSNVFILMEEGWEYNDEIFFHPASGSGTPHKVFDTKEAAILECNKLNIEAIQELFTSGEVNSYFYNIYDIIPTSNLKDLSKRHRLDQLVDIIFGCDIDNLRSLLNRQSKIVIKSNVPDDIWLEFQRMTTLNFWDVVECERE